MKTIYIGLIYDNDKSNELIYRMTGAYTSKQECERAAREMCEELLNPEDDICKYQYEIGEWEVE